MNILIITFRFPPLEGIASRRWAKFSKELAKKGHVVHVVTASNDANSNASRNWLSDISHENIIVHYARANYPVSLLSNNNFFSKVVKKVLNMTTHQLDYAERWYRNMLPISMDILDKHEITNVIVSSPPGSVAYAASYLKIQFPHINLIQDFRDCWNDDPVFCFPNGISSFRQKERYSYMEMFVAHHCNYLLNVTEDLTDRYKNKYPHLESKFLTLYNGYDKDDIVISESPQNIGKVKVIYAGSLNVGRVNALDLIASVLLDCDFISRKINFSFYTNLPKHQYSTMVSECIERGFMQFHDFIPPKDVYEKINESDVCLSINSPCYPYAFGTKIFDYMNMNKSIFHISNGGELSTLLLDCDEYVSNYSYDSIKSMLTDISNREVKSKRCINSMYDKFDIKSLTNEIEDILV